MYRIFCLIFAALSLQFSSIASAELTLDQLEAKEVVDRYFDALKQGDTNTIQNLLDGDLLTTQRALLNNPNYPQHLVEMYKDATYVITTTETTGDGYLMVAAEIRLNDEESMQTTYLLHRAARENTASDQLYIFAEIFAQ